MKKKLIFISVCFIIAVLVTTLVFMYNNPKQSFVLIHGPSGSFPQVHYESRIPGVNMPSIISEKIDDFNLPVTLGNQELRETYPNGIKYSCEFYVNSQGKGVVLMHGTATTENGTEIPVYKIIETDLIVEGYAYKYLSK